MSDYAKAALIGLTCGFVSATLVPSGNIVGYALTVSLSLFVWAIWINKRKDLE